MNNKSMQQGKAAVWIVVAVALVAFFAALVGSYASAKTYGASVEASLKATKDDSRNVFAQAGQKIREVAQVPAMYAEDVERVARAAIEARYGDEGSKAAFQWLTEQNPQLDASVYTTVQQVISSSRRDFENAQRRQIDVRRQYEAALGSFWRGFWLAQAGYPKINLDDYQIVSTAHANTVFEAGQEEGPVQLR